MSDSKDNDDKFLAFYESVTELSPWAKRLCNEINKAGAWKSLIKMTRPYPNPVWIGVDWAAGNGMIRGEVIKREGNISHVRFKTVGVEPDGKLV